MEDVYADVNVFNRDHLQDNSTVKVCLRINCSQHHPEGRCIKS